MTSEDQPERSGGWRPKHPVIDGLIIIGIVERL